MRFAEGHARRAPSIAALVFSAALLTKLACRRRRHLPRCPSPPLPPSPAAHRLGRAQTTPVPDASSLCSCLRRRHAAAARRSARLALQGPGHPADWRRQQHRLLQRRASRLSRVSRHPPAAVQWRQLGGQAAVYTLQGQGLWRKLPPGRPPDRGGLRGLRGAGGCLAGAGARWWRRLASALHCTAHQACPAAACSASQRCLLRLLLQQADATAPSPFAAAASPQVFDSGSRTLLRQFKGGHKAPVHVAKFAADQQHVLTGGDDGLLILWDVISGQQVSAGQQHWAAIGSTGQHWAARGSTGQHGAARGSTGHHWTPLGSGGGMHQRRRSCRLSHVFPASGGAAKRAGSAVAAAVAGLCRSPHAICVLLLAAVQVSNFRGHSDYIRSAALSPASEDVWATSR